MEYEHLVHGFEPVYDQNSKVLILGSFPSVKSRETDFYYGHPQNRFWRLIAYLFGEATPSTVEEKKRLLLAHGLAVWDVIAQCDIKGSSDASIKNAVPADIKSLLEKTGITRIFVNGGKAAAVYEKYQLPLTGIPAVKLPSTSPANAAWSLDRLLESWRIILNSL